MCWISKNIPVIQIAKEDIPIFKVTSYNETSKKILSLFQYFEYEEGRLYNLLEKLKVVPYCILGTEYDEYRIYKGFHSYSCENKIMEMPLGYLISYYDIKNSWIGRKNSWIDGKKSSIVKLNCVIPKGSEYCLNEFGEYVSNKIKIINVENICAGVVDVSQS